MVASSRFLTAISLLAGIQGAVAWSSPTNANVVRRTYAPKEEKLVVPKTAHQSSASRLNMLPVGTEELSSVAIAVAAAPSSAISALVAYGHYGSLMALVGSLTTERLTIKPNMSEEEETRLAITDAIYGLAGVLIVFTGYLRLTQYGKGVDFYLHNPIFWVKMNLLAIMGAASFFPTTKIIQRAVAKQNGNFEPMSEKLASRMTSIINAELLAVFSIPLAASLMARGVFDVEVIPWQVEAAFVPVFLLGLGGKYIKEALDWQED